MLPDSAAYRVFPIEVVSNTFDFDVRRVMHNTQQMRGVFSRRVIGPAEVPIYIGAYPGYRKHRPEMESKTSRFAARYLMEEKAAVQQISAYLLSLQRYDPGCVLDPTDEDGKLLPEFKPYIVSYLNEPPPGFKQKAVFVYNQARQRYEVWLIQPVEPDEEVYLYYGKRYLRNYSIETNAIEAQFAYFIPAASNYLPDPRGVPQPLDAPDELSTGKAT
jgi:hypothetical protein